MGIDEVFVNVAKKPGMRKSGFIPYVRSDTSSPEDYIKNVIYATYPNKHTIFKLMYNQINHHSGLRDFITREKIPMIHLRRKNLVKQVISGHTAAKTDHSPIVISPSQLFKQVEKAEKEAYVFSVNFRDQIKLELWYEDIIGLSEDGFTYVEAIKCYEICKFFGVDSTPLRAKTKKKNKNDLSVYLPNIEEIRDFFKGSKYEWQLKGGK